MTRKRGVKVDHQRLEEAFINYQLSQDSELPPFEAEASVMEFCKKMMSREAFQKPSQGGYSGTHPATL